jgi:hypothetical protein
MPPFGVSMGLQAPKPASSGPPVPGYTLWLDATYSGNTDSTWVDQSGNGYNATLTSGTAPVLTPNAVNGKAAYLFSGPGTSTLMQTPALPALTAPCGFAVFIVFQCSNTSLQTSVVDANFDLCYSIEYGSSYGPEFWVGGSDYLAGGTTDTSTHCLAMTYDSVSGNRSCYLDGTLLNTTTIAGSSLPSQPRTIGCFHSYSGVTWAGHICAVLEYDSETGPALTNTQITDTSAFLQGEWAFP